MDALLSPLPTSWAAQCPAGQPTAEESRHFVPILARFGLRRLIPPRFQLGTNVAFKERQPRGPRSDPGRSASHFSNPCRRNRTVNRRSIGSLVVAALLLPTAALAEDGVTPGQFVANNVWMMLAAALVFIMHLGFATLESGMTRAKNTTNILFKNTFIISIGILTYALCGFNLMYPGDFNGFVGFAGMGITTDAAGNTPPTQTAVTPTGPTSCSRRCSRRPLRRSFRVPWPSASSSVRSWSSRPCSSASSTRSWAPGSGAAAGSTPWASTTSRVPRSCTRSVAGAL